MTERVPGEDDSAIRVGSLFSGAGGLDLGFSRLEPYQVVFHLDNDDTAVETLRANSVRDGLLDENATIVNADVTEYVRDYPENVGEDQFLPPSEIDFLVGGPPCQPFSAAARRSGGIDGVEDDDGQLFLAYVQMLEEWNPTGFLFENVYGITSDEDDWQMIVDTFADAGYDVTHRTLDAADYGVPQHRARTFIVGVDQDEDTNFDFPRPTHGPDSPGGPELTTAGDVLEDLDQEGADRSDTYEITSKHAHLLEDIPEGLNYSFYTEKLGHPNPVFGWRSRFSDYLYKADPDSPVRTLKAQPGAASGPFHWDNRKFTEAELKRLQSFPDEYDLCGSYGQVVSQIGNSVPPDLAETLAKAIAAQLFDRSLGGDLPSMSDQFDLSFRSRKRTSTEEYRRKARERLEEMDLWNPAVRRENGQSGLGSFDKADDTTTDEKGKREFTWVFESPFEHSRHSAGTTVEPSGSKRVYTEQSVRDGTTLDVSVERQEVSSDAVITITLHSEEGLIPHVDTITLEAKGVELDDIFYLWYVLSTASVERTRYEKFTDIVGHYSTTKSDYDSKVELTGFENTTTTAALRHFSRENHCNREYSISELQSAIGAGREELIESLQQLREWRYEIRTPSTHSTIPEGAVLCTYPFPDLNERSHFDGDIELQSLRSGAD